MVNNYKKEKNNLIQLATEQQHNAANPNNSVWVEASAGTGKTKVLSDRVLRLLLAKVEPSKILCLTYTKAAAVEMSERITKRLSTWAVQSQNDLEIELSKLLGDDFNISNKLELSNFARTLFATLLDTPGGMKIQTIHSFCQDILKRFPLEAGISPYFEVMDTRASKEILQNIKIDLLKKVDVYENVSLRNAIEYMAKNISEFSFPKIMNMITENRNKINELLKKYNNDILLLVNTLEEKLGVESHLTTDDIKKHLMDNINKDNFKSALLSLQQGSSTDLEKANAFAIVGENNFDIKYYDVYKNIFLKKDGSIRATLATQKVVKNNPQVLEFMQNEAQKLIETANKLSSLNILHSTSALLYIAKNIIDEYNNYKSIYATLDYEDLIVITKNLLENRTVADWVLFKLDGGIEHILIDEAQDTSPNQWAIIKALTSEFFAGIGAYENKLERTVFVVGDRKQSIYSFQGADPKEFDKMCNYFEECAHNFKKIHLDVSFRSTKAIMDCVNTLFECDCAKKGVVPENEHINHCPFRLGEGGRVEVLPLVLADTEQKKEDYSWKIPINRVQKTSVSNLLAKQIARNIKNMVINKDILLSKNRPVQYGDFMFLVQQRNCFVEEFVRACKEIGVSVAGVDKLKLLEQIAVQDLISLGKFLLLPNDDLSLAEVLKSPIFGLNDDDLFNICYNRKGSVFDSLLKNNKYVHIADQLKELLNFVGFMRPFELFSYVLIKLNGRKNFISRMGNEVEDVLDEFINLTIVFEQSNTPSLQKFIDWIAKDEVIIQKEMEQGNNNTVKIMTVHGSKGLQAPIVILGDTTKIKNKSLKSELLWEDDTVFFPTESANYNDLCKKIKSKLLDADFDEYRRLLYVALTRAEDRLYVAGYTKDKDANEESWYKLLQNNLKSNIEHSKEERCIIYDVAQENTFDNDIKIESEEINFTDYSYLLSEAPCHDPLSKPYAPSRDENDELDISSSPLEDNGKFYKRGTAIHKLLQYISTVSIDNRFNASICFLKKQLPDFSYNEIKKIVEEVLNLCGMYSEIFAENSMAEVPIIGEIDGKIISAKIDRLVLSDNKVIIVDYKTNRPSAKTIDDVPSQYINQMKYYKLLMERIYPNKIIETYLLWTNTCNMMKI